MTIEELRTNKLAREQAELWEAIIEEECQREIAESALGEKYHKRIWEVLRDLALKRVPLQQEPKRLQPMTDEEAKQFERRIMAFGQYQHKLIEDVPLSYLDWCGDVMGHFVDELRRYLLNGNVQREKR